MATPHIDDITDADISRICAGNHRRFWIGTWPGEETLCAIFRDRGLDREPRFETDLFAIDLDNGRAILLRSVEEPPRRRALPSVNDAQVARRALTLLLAACQELDDIKQRQKTAKDRKTQSTRARYALQAAIRDQLERAACPRQDVLGAIDLQPLTDRDIDLACVWANQTTRDEVRRIASSEGRRGLAESLRERSAKELRRLLSARASELAATKWLRQSGVTVNDVSATQLEVNAGAWRTHDLEIVGRPLATHTVPAFWASETDERSLIADVKSTQRPRRRYGSTQWSSSPLVPQFKKYRGGDVPILGVIAEYSYLDALLEVPSPRNFTREPQFTVLGWTSKPRLDALASWSVSRNLVVKYDTRGAVPAPWVYETGAITSIESWPADALHSLIPTGENVSTLLGLDAAQAMAIALTFEQTLQSAALPDATARFVGLLSDGIQRFGRVLPVLYLSVVQHFAAACAARRRGEWAHEFDPREYTRVLWVSSDVIERFDLDYTHASPTRSVLLPLGVFDPEATMFFLLRGLQRLWRTNAKQLPDYHNFELSATSILRARNRKTDRVETLLAHCGGSDHYGVCGAFPLLLGVHRHCREGYLVCECGYCCNHCTGKTPANNVDRADLAF